MSNRRYLYNCYCGPIRIREDDKSSHPGYIYDNCPRVTAPEIVTPRLSEIKDFRIEKFHSNLSLYIDVLRNSGIYRADLVGSFVRGHQTFSSDIDIRITCPPDVARKIPHICLLLNQIDGLQFDLTTKADSLLMPHMKLPKGDMIKLFDDRTGYVYSES